MEVVGNSWDWTKMSLKQMKEKEFQPSRMVTTLKKNPKEMSYFETSKVSSFGQVQKTESEGTTEKTGPGQWK